MSERTSVNTLTQREKTGFVLLKYRWKNDPARIVHERIISSEESEHFMHRSSFFPFLEYHQLSGLYE